MTKEYKLGVNTILVVEVPEDSSDFHLNADKNGNYLEFETILHGDDPGTYDCIDLPPGKWTLLGKASSITEEQANGLAVAHGTWAGKYKSYSTYSFSDANTDAFFDAHRWANTALESFHSWLTANGIDKDDLILKKE